jgi:RNA polymerase sigma-70 factor (ECF subfamily)
MEQPGEQPGKENRFTKLGIHRDATGTDSVADNELLVRRTFQTNARLGCELLYRRYYQPLCSHAARYVYSKAIAEDIVAEVFCQFYEKGVFQKIETSYRAYLYKTVRSRVYNYLRWETTRTADISLADFTAIQHTLEPDSIIEYEELYHSIELAVDALPPQCRKIYLLSRFENKSYQEIASELQIAPRTVEVQLRRARIALRTLLHSKWALMALAILTGLLP